MIRFYLSGLIFLLFSLPVPANMLISQAIVTFESEGTKSHDIEIYNQGEETLYLKVEAKQVLSPGTKQEIKQAYRDPQQAGLLVTPQRLILPPKTRKKVRFVKLADSKSLQHDAVFRVLVKPEVGELKATQTAVKVIVAYEILVLMQPDKPRASLQGEVENKRLKLINTGNTNVLLQKGYQCPPGQKRQDELNQCQELVGKRMYAGNQWQLNLPYNTPVEFEILTGLDADIIWFEPKEIK
ncbi:MAG: hypothetical protein OEY19_07360 [Gammaproteobacteria bacterium]|nr:hypothetical protein [Gammaproteobacteria bacterium]MDH5631087.1 hypothetical protein [Gammaproteobacteria bacterium]